MIKEKLKKIYYKMTGTFKQLKFNKKNFTIISNNCFGGRVYMENALPYLTPTCGMYFFAEDYIKFIYNMKEYLKEDLKEIKIEDSKYKEEIQNNGKEFLGVIAKLKDIEIIMLHYSDFKTAKEKWDRRKKRINYDRIIYKFNDQNLCTYEHLKKFNEFPAKYKICFTAKKYNDIDTIQLPQYKYNDYVLSDAKSKDYKKYFNIYKFINNMS